MRAGKALALFFTSFIPVNSHAQVSALPQLISCLVHYQSQTETQRLAKALAVEEEIAVKSRPEIISSIENHDDLINGKKNPQNSQWSVSLNQSLYSYSENKEIEAQSQIIKSETELTKFETLQSTLSLVDQFMSYISSVGQVKILKSQMESQKKAFNILNEMVKARIIDGSQMLMAESDFKQSQVALKDSELEVENLEKNLKILPFYQSLKFQNFEQIENFFARSDSEPIKVDQRSELKVLEHSLKANQNLYLKESRSWVPRLNASVKYAQSLNNPESRTYSNEMIGSLTLTFPLSDSVYRSKRASLYKSEIHRIEILADRTKSQLKVSLENQKKTFLAAKEQLLVLFEAITSLKKAKEILQKKLQLNKASYIEYSEIEGRINLMTSIELEKKIAIWKMMAVWESEKRAIQKFNDAIGCQ